MQDVRMIEDYFDFHTRFRGPEEVLEATVDRRDAVPPRPPEHQGFIGFFPLKERRDAS